MNVLSPVTALVSAALPAGVGLLQGEHLGVAGLVGVPLALAAVVPVSAGHGAGAVRPPRTALLFACGAGAAIALQLVFLHQAPTDSGVAPLVVGRTVSSAVTLCAAAPVFRRLRPERPAYALSATAGVLDSVANLLFLLAARSGASPSSPWSPRSTRRAPSCSPAECSPNASTAGRPWASAPPRSP
nr:hypothetical protein [Streptomyces sp. CC53]